MNLATLRQDVVVAVRDMMRQEAVTQVCDSHPGPPTRAQPSSNMPEPRREECVLLARASTDALSQDQAVATSGDGVWPTFDHTMPVPVPTEIPAMYAEDLRLNPYESCLAQRFRNTPHSQVVPATTGMSVCQRRGLRNSPMRTQV